MDNRELLETYKILLGEVNRLTEENRQLKAQLGHTRSAPSQNSALAIKPENYFFENEPVNSDYFLDVNNNSGSFTKISLFMSLFKGRDDVYAKRWENKSKGTSGYSPVCLNQWQIGVCGKPKNSCSKCDHKLYAALVRKFETALLTFSMSRRHEIQFKSYDRLFPSQDTMPKGGLGNLIALPFQKAARKSANSEFVDENYESYDDQWAFLSTIQKISENRLDTFITELCHGSELGELKIDEEEESEKPWGTSKDKFGLQKKDFPKRLDIVKANMLFIPKAAVSQRGLNRLKRLASFKNPMFYKQ